MWKSTRRIRNANAGNDNALFNRRKKRTVKDMRSAKPDDSDNK